MKITTIIAATLAVVASTISVSAAVAAPVTTEVKVSVADLNLNSTAGQASLERRIKLAAVQACGVDQNERQLGVKQETQHCYDTAISQARVSVAAINPPVLASR